MSNLTRKIRTRGPVFLARELIGTLALHGWRPTRDRIRRFVANARSVDNAGLPPRQAYEDGRIAQYEFCQRYAKDPPRGRERMLAHLLEQQSGFRGVVLYPTSHVPEQRERPEHLLRVWAEAGYLCLMLPVDSAVPSIECLGERLYLARLVLLKLLPPLL